MEVTAFWLSIASIVVALGSAIAAIWSVTQTSRYHPKPFLDARFEHHRGDDPYLEVTIYNFANGEASYVQLRVRTPHGTDITTEGSRHLPKDASMTEWISTVDGTIQRTLNKYGAYVMKPGDDVPGKYRVTAYWAQSPNHNKRRSKTFTYTLKP